MEAHHIREKTVFESPIICKNCTPPTSIFFYKLIFYYKLTISFLPLQELEEECECSTRNVWMEITSGHVPSFFPLMGERKRLTSAWLLSLKRVKSWLMGSNKALQINSNHSLRGPPQSKATKQNRISPVPSRKQLARKEIHLSSQSTTIIYSAYKTRSFNNWREKSSHSFLYCTLAFFIVSHFLKSCNTLKGCFIKENYSKTKKTSRAFGSSTYLLYFLKLAL